MEFIKSHFDFKFYKSTIFGLILFLLLAPLSMYLPKEFAYENSWIENIQLIVLTIGAIFALTAKFNKKFFKFVALVLGILFLREINCGRSVFFPIPDKPNSFYSWKEIKYGWLAHPLYGAYMTWTGIYFLINKLYITLWNYIKKVKFPVWDCLFIIIGIIVGWYSEHKMDNMVLEEAAELLFYIGLVTIIYHYSHSKDFNISEE